MRIYGLGLTLRGGELEEAVVWVEVSLKGCMVEESGRFATQGFYRKEGREEGRVGSSGSNSNRGQPQNLTLFRGYRYVTAALKKADDRQKLTPHQACLQ